MNWLAMAILTSVLWGLCYASTEQIVKHINVKTYLAISSFICCIGFCIFAYFEPSQKDFNEKFLKALPWIAISIVSSFLGSFCSTYAIKHGGASLSAVIEISYPVWVVLFTSIFSWQNNFSTNLFLGGSLIFLGTVLVIRS
ncbi:MAG: DMT family transporter [bacterium]